METNLLEWLVASCTELGPGDRQYLGAKATGSQQHGGDVLKWVFRVSV